MKTEKACCERETARRAHLCVDRLRKCSSPFLLDARSLSKELLDVAHALAADLRRLDAVARRARLEPLEGVRARRARLEPDVLHAAQGHPGRPGRRRRGCGGRCAEVDPAGAARERREELLLELLEQRRRRL